MTSGACLKPEAFDPETHPRRLNLGCGYDLRDGFVNVDMNVWHRPDLLADIRDLAFLPERFYEEIVAQDVLEHLPRTDTLAVLSHWNRLLVPGGRIVLRVPSLMAIADILRRPDGQSPARQEEILKYLFGTQAYTGDFHFTSFTDVLLRHYLREAGFEPESVEVFEEWLFDASARKVRHVDCPPVRDYSALLEIADDGEFVRACFREILRRDPDPGGFDYFVGGLRDATMGRRTVVEIMVNSEERRPRQ